MESMHELCLMHARADRTLRGLIAKQLESQRLTMMEWLALGVISNGSKSGLSMSEVAEALDVTLPQVTALVQDLIKLKLIKQKVLKTDHRGRQVGITLKGRRVLGKLEKIIAAAIGNWSKGIPPARMREYIKTVRQLAQVD